MLSGANDTSDESLESTEGGYAGLYRWTMDALFGSRVSPSRKYKEFAQDDTNYKREGRRRVRSPESTIMRSNSWSGLDSGFYRRNDLLPPSIEEDMEVPRPIESSNSLLNSSRVYRRPEEQPTDTFAARRRRLGDDGEDHSIVLQSPQQDDPLISKLFQKKLEPANLKIILKGFKSLANSPLHQRTLSKRTTLQIIWKY